MAKNRQDKENGQNPIKEFKVNKENIENKDYKEPRDCNNHNGGVESDKPYNNVVNATCDPTETVDSKASSKKLKCSCTNYSEDSENSEDCIYSVECALKNKVKYPNITYFNAGAGSGKTYKLTHILADEIRNHGVDPSEVIMTTFTVDASSDLRERSRSVLYEEGMFSAAARMDLALIGTVHSLGQRFINKYWYQLGLSPSMKVMDEISAQAYINSSLANLPTEEDLSLFHRAAKVFNITCKDDYERKLVDRDFWKGMLESVIHMAQDYRIDSFEESINSSINRVRDIIKPHFHFSLDKSDFKGTLQAIIDHVRNQNSNAARIREKTAQDLLKRNWDWDFNDFIALLDFFKPLPARDRKKIGGIENDIEQLEKLYRSEELFDLIEQTIRRIFSLAKKWRDEYQEYKKRNSIIDYHDMEQYFLEALDIQEVEEDIRSSYKCLMVDEFQDSNQVQVAIFVKLSSLVERCYWCGDSKQAIYGFRGADTELTRNIVKGLQSSCLKRVEKLPKSYRSLPKIVDFCNNLFKRAFRPQEMEEDEVTLKEHRNAKDETPQVQVFRSHTQNKASFCFDIAHLVEDLHTNKETNKEGVPYKDIAILNMNNNTLDKIAEELINKNIPVNRGTGDLLLQKETVLLQNIITLIMDPDDELAKTHIYHLTKDQSSLGDIIDQRLEFLSQKQAQEQIEKEMAAQGEERKPNKENESKGALENDKENNGNIDTHDTNTGKSEEEPDTEPGTLEEIKWLEDTPLIIDILREQPSWCNLNVSTLIRNVILELNLRSILKSWGEGWQKREDNLFKLIDLAKEYEALCDKLMSGATVFGFINYLNRQGGKGAGDAEGVILQTFHSSKGLQWKNVIVTSLDQDPLRFPVSRNFCGVNRLPKDPNVVPTLENPFPEYWISVIPDIFGPNGDAFPEDIRDRIKEDKQYKNACDAKKYEWVRLLYVAITRAKDRLILAVNEGKNSIKGIEVLGLPEIMNKEKEEEARKKSQCGNSESAQGNKNSANTENPDPKEYCDLFGIKHHIKVYKFENESDSDKKVDGNDKNFEANGDTIESTEKPELINLENLDNPDTETFYDLPKKQAPEEGYRNKFVAPSHAHDAIEFDPQDVKVVGLATGKRFYIKGEPPMNLVGDCIHNAYASFNGDDVHDLQVIKDMIEGFELEGSLNYPEGIVRSHRFLVRELKKRHGEPQQISHEMPFIHHMGDQFVKGSIDLVWHYGDKVVIIDYKTFPGGVEDTLNPESIHYGGKHQPQLDLYRSALSRAGKSVLATYIYYPVLQHLVEVQ